MRQIDDHKVKPYFFFFFSLILFFYAKIRFMSLQGREMRNCDFETHYRMGWNWKLLIGLLQIHVQPHVCDVMCLCCEVKKKKKKKVFFGHVCSTHCSLRSSILFGDSFFIFIFLRNRIACLLFMANLAYQKKKLWPTCNCCNIKINVSSYQKFKLINKISQKNIYICELENNH